MPIYEYQCQSCGHIFDKLIRSLPTSLTVNCEKCHGNEVEKLVSGFAFSTSTGIESSPDSSSSCHSCTSGNCQACKN